MSENLINSYNFLTFEKEEIETLADVDVQMAYIYNFIENAYKYCDYTVYYAVYYKSIWTHNDLYLIEINGTIVRFIEITNNSDIKYNTNNMALAEKQIKRFLERRY